MRNTSAESLSDFGFGWPNHRLPGESFENYRLRRRLQKAKEKAYLNGRVFWNALKVYLVERQDGTKAFEVLGPYKRIYSNT